MTDIVERLRRLEVNPFSTHPKRMLEEAADEITRLRAALELWHHAVKIDVTMEGPQYMGVSSILGRQAWERTRAALQQEEK